MYKKQKTAFPPQDYEGFLSESKSLKLEFSGQGMEGNLWLCWDFHNFSI